MIPLPPHIALKNAIRAFPAYLYTFVVGFIIALIEDINVTTFALTGAVTSFAAHSALIGVAAFAIIYSLGRIVFLLGQIIAQHNR